MTRADVGKRRPAEAGGPQRTRDRITRGLRRGRRTRPLGARDRIARIDADLDELANDGLLKRRRQDVDLPAVWGRAPSRAARELTESENLKKAFLIRHTVLQPRAGGGTAGSVRTGRHQTLEQGRIIGIKDRDRWAIPAWQLDADTRDGYLNGIDRLTRVFPGGPVALTRWVTRPAADFDGRTPRDLLASNRVDEVVRAAKALTAKGW